MSFKLQDRIQRLKGLPRKYKSLLLAMASHAYNDGSNVYQAKDTMASEMGVSRFTVNRNMDGLLVTGLVRQAISHRCSNDWCPKGSRHYTQRGNHWTQAYDIDLEALQKVSPAPRVASHFVASQSAIVASHFEQESQHILHNSGVTFCAAKQLIENPATLGTNTEASALTSGSESVSESVSDSHPEDRKEKPEAHGSEEETKAKPNPEAPSSGTCAILATLYPQVPPKTAHCAELNALVARHPDIDWRDLLEWNRTHKPPELVFRSAEKLLKGIDYALNDYVMHDVHTCRVCTPKPRAGSHAETNPEIHTGKDAQGKSLTEGKITI